MCISFGIFINIAYTNIIIRICIDIIHIYIYIYTYIIYIFTRLYGAPVPGVAAADPVEETLRHPHRLLSLLL